MTCQRCRLDTPGAKFCPNCGWKPGMSGTNKFLIAIALLFGVPGICVGLSATSGSSSDPAPVASAPAPRPRPIGVSAARLFKDYDANEVSADDAYKGRRLQVSGVIASIDKDMFDHVVVHLVGASRYQTVSATMLPSEKSAAARLSKGNTMDVVCVGAGKIITDPQLDDCSIL